MHAGRLVRASAAAALMAGASVTGVGIAPAFAGTAVHQSTFFLPLMGPTPSGCPLQGGPFALISTDGNGVQHFEVNKNGDWGGETFEGNAQLGVFTGFDNNGNPLVTPLYDGHLTLWGGGGQNSNPGGTPTQQSEGGDTLTYHGTAISGAGAPSGTITIRGVSHTTTNNAGTTTSNFSNMSCTP